MSFREKWRISPKVEVKFVERIFEYLFDELLKNDAYYLNDDWCQSEYELFTSNALFTAKNTCASPNSSFYWHIPITVNQRQTQDNFNQYIESLVIPNNIRNRILQCKNNGKEYAAVCLDLKYTELDYGHAAMLMFDLKDNLQWYFDPDDAINTISLVSYVKAFSRTAYIDGFDVVPPSLVATSLHSFSIQPRFENVNEDHDGLCGILVAIVLVCCIRFDYWNTQKMSHMILQAANTPQLKNELMRKFIYWYMEIDHLGYDTGVIRELMNVPCKNNDSICGVFMKDTNGLCRRRPNPKNNLHQYCWQHRKILQE